MSIRQVFEAVEVGRVDLGLVPMDNSQAGSINETYDLFLRHGLHLVGEIAVPVDHCLMGMPGVLLEELTEVFSHPQALAQCEEFLSSLGALARADYDTAGAARRIANEKRRTRRPSPRGGPRISTASACSPSASRPTPTTRPASGSCRRTSATRRGGQDLDRLRRGPRARLPLPLHRGRSPNATST